MPSKSTQFPSQFSKIGKYTIQEGSWELPFETPAKANAFKTSWYAYARLLDREGKLEEHAAAVRVKARVKGSTLIFEDRDTSEVAKKLDAILVNLKGDSVDEAFQDMMAHANMKLGSITLTPTKPLAPPPPLPEPKVFHVRVFRDEDVDLHPDTGDYNEASIRNLFAIHRFSPDDIKLVDSLDKGEYLVIHDINIRRL